MKLDQSKKLPATTIRAKADKLQGYSVCELN